MNLDMSRIVRSIPYFKKLVKSPSQNRWELLHSFPPFVFNDFLDILQNIVLGTVKIKNFKRNLARYRKVLIDMINEKSLAAKKRLLLTRFPLKPAQVEDKEKVYIINPVSGKRKLDQYFGDPQVRQDGNGFIWSALLPLLTVLGKEAAGYAANRIMKAVSGE